MIRPTLLALLLVLGPATAAAQAISALRNHRVDGPIEWEADRSELLGREDTALFIGNVRVLQGDLELTSDRLYVFYKLRPGEDDPDVERLDATGSVVVTSPSETARGDWGVYDIPNRIITLGGNVVVARGDTRLAGERLEIDLESGVTRLDARTEDDSRGRVRGRFTLPQGETGPDGGGR